MPAPTQGRWTHFRSLVGMHGWLSSNLPWCMHGVYHILPVIAAWVSGTGNLWFRFRSFEYDDSIYSKYIYICVVVDCATLVWSTVRALQDAPSE